MGRRDARLVKNLDSMHIIVPLLYPGRCDNEAYISERIDLTNINAFLEKKNRELAEAAKRDAKAGEDPVIFKYTIFHLIVTSVLKIMYLRPKMNYFIQNKRIYERYEKTASFVIKKQFSDHSAEALAFLRGEENDTIDTIHEKIRQQVHSGRSDKKDGSTEAMDIVSKLPFFVVRFFVWLMRQFDVRGKVPASLISSDPYYTSVVLSNLGSSRLRSGYHHLTNWGTNSLFVIIGEKKIRPFFAEDGSYEMRDSLDLGITVDERIADGYYYSKTIRLLKKLLEEPELLERSLAEEVDYD